MAEVLLCRVSSVYLLELLRLFMFVLTVYVEDFCFSGSCVVGVGGVRVWFWRSVSVVRHGGSV